MTRRSNPAHQLALSAPAYTGIRHTLGGTVCQERSSEPYVREASAGAAGVELMPDNYFTRDQMGYGSEENCHKNAED